MTEDSVWFIPSYIGRSLSGVKLLGGVVSRNKSFILEITIKRSVRAVELIHLLPKLRDPHNGLLLLRLCMDIAKLFLALGRAN
jgi:hypothetical protein